MTDRKALYGYDPFASSGRSVAFVFLMLVCIFALAVTSVLFAYGTPWFLLPLVGGSLALYGIIKIDKLEAIGRCYLYRVPRKHVAVVRSAYISGWRQNLIESPRAAVFAKSLVEDDCDEHKNRRNRLDPRLLANGLAYWGFCHDNDKRVENPFYAAWLIARVLDEKNETWDSMPRLISIASAVRNYVQDRKFTEATATTVTSLTMAWFYSEMSDDDAESALAEHGPELTRLLLEGVSMEYALEML